MLGALRLPRVGPVWWQDPDSPGGGAPSDGGLLFAWAERRVCLYLNSLHTLLPQARTAPPLQMRTPEALLASVALDAGPVLFACQWATQAQVHRSGS